MKKVVKVNYPKKRSRINLHDLGDVSEPERCSMYQVLQNNLQLVNRVTFLHRIIYVGSHKFTSYETAKTVFMTIINKCNETYCLEKLSGFLLYYHRYVVHMVEGDEDNLNKHLGYLLDKKANHCEYLGTIKLLIHVSNINQRFFEDWISYTGFPSKLLERLDVNADLQQSGRCIYNCIKKLYILMGAYAEDLATITETAPEKNKAFDEATIPSLDYTDSSRIYSSLSNIGSNADSLDRNGDTLAQKEYKFFLPEYELLEFVIQSNFTMKLQEYYDLYGVVPMRDIYKDKVWPVPHDFIPYDVFEGPYNCVTELSKAIKKQFDKTHSLSVAASLASFMELQTTKTTTDVQTSEIEVKQESVLEVESENN